MGLVLEAFEVDARKALEDVLDDSQLASSQVGDVVLEGGEGALDLGQGGVVTAR